MIVAFIQSEFDPSKDYNEIYNEDELIISLNEKGTILSNECSVIRTSYDIPKKNYPKDTTLRTLERYIIGLEERKMCDNEVKDIILLEGNKTKGIYKYILNKSAFQMVDKVVFVKKYDFYLDNENFYSFATSVNDIFYKTNDEYIRVYDIVNAYHIYEDEEKFYFRHIIQRKERAPLPQSMIIANVPKNTRKFFDAIRKNIRPIKEDKRNSLINENSKGKSFVPDEIYLQYVDMSLSNDEIFHQEWYRQEEVEIVQFSKQFIVAFMKSEFDQKRNYKEFYNNDRLVFNINEKGSIFSSNFTIVRMNYSIPKSEFPKGTTMKTLVRYIFEPDIRSKWDKDFKLIKKLEGDNECSIIHYIMKKPLFFISDRDLIDKIYNFFHQGNFYSFASSVPDDYIPLVKDVTRVTDIVMGYWISEDRNNFYFRTLSQIDIKITVPQSLMNKTIPSKLKGWFEEIKRNIIPIPEDAMEEEKKVENENNINIEEILMNEEKENDNNKAIEINDDIYNKYIDKSLSNDNIFDSNWYRNDEKITYSIQHIIALINSEFDSIQEYNKINEKEGILLAAKANGSFITKEFPIFKLVTIIQKKDFPQSTSIEQIFDLLYTPELRKGWDSSIKDFKYLKGEKEKGIVHIWNKRPIILMDDRDSVDKIFLFSHNSNKYSFSTSVNNSFFLEIPNVPRMINYFTCLEVSEKEDSFIFHIIMQVDYKMTQSLVNFSILTNYCKMFKDLKTAKAI